MLEKRHTEPAPHPGELVQRNTQLIGSKIRCHKTRAIGRVL
jgi:hypothetical protein